MRETLHDDPSAGGSVHEVWTGHATNRAQWPLATLGAGTMALGIGLAVDPAWAKSMAPLLMAVIGCIAAGLLIIFGTLAFVHVHVTVGSEAVEVRCGHVGLPRRRIPLDNVAGAYFMPRVTPHEWGGWGYRWRPEKGTAIVVRRGEGLVVRMRDGRVFTVTVDNAEGAVRAIRARLARLGGPRRAAQA